MKLLLFTIPFFDFLLTKLIGKKARWFQLHATVNIVICTLIGKQSLKLLMLPSLPLLQYSQNDVLALQMVIGLHIYHLFIGKTLSFIEWWHHLCFVAFGALPVLFLYNNQIISLFLFTGCGLPGAIEYTLLTMVKNNTITSLQQKNINSWINNYVRCPISLYTVSFIHINNCYTGNYNFLEFYIMFLVFLNGTFFNKIAIENYICHYNQKNSIKF